MTSGFIDSLLAWIGEHPLAAGAVIFLIAFIDALVVVGIAVPAVPLLFAVGTLVGLGYVDGYYAVAAAALGAFLGDGLSFWVGRRFGPALRSRWPFSKHPEWLDNGERMFRRNGAKGVIVARYVGAVRPFVPAIAGMLQVPARQFFIPSAVAAIAWALTFLLPGWALGASLDVVAAVAGRLALVVGLLLVVLAAIWACVYYVWRWAAPRTSLLLERALAWSHRHPVLGRYSGALIDPTRPESASVLALATLLLAAGWLAFTLLLRVGGQGEPLALDLWVHQAMFALRNPLADDALAVTAALGDWPVLGPASLLVFAWFAWRRRMIAAWHWLAAIAFAWGLTEMLGHALHVPRPPAATAVAGFGFPSAPVTMATVVFGFFAVLIARELPGRSRMWPYVVAALAVATLAFSRVYLGAHWLSDVLGGMLLGTAWVAGLGVAYRRRVRRSFWMQPLAIGFFAAIGLMAAWYGPRNARVELARYEAPLVQEPMPAARWWAEGWSSAVPARRNSMDTATAWPLNVQYAGELEPLVVALEAGGWERYAVGGWFDLLRTLDDDASPADLRILPSAHRGRGEALVMVRPGATPAERQVLRLWHGTLALQPDGGAGPAPGPLWMGTAQTLRYTTALDGFVRYWEVLPDAPGALDAVRAATTPLERAEGEHAERGVAVLRLRAQAGADDATP